MEKLQLKNGTSYDLNLAGFYFVGEKNKSVGFEILTNKTLDEIIADFSNTDNVSTLKVLRNESELRTYEGYTILSDSFGVESGVTYNDTEYKMLVKLTLKMPELAVENFEEASIAIAYAIENAPNSVALKFVSLYPKWESFIGKSMEADVRFQYNGELWQTRQAIATVLENQYPSIDTAALYERIDEEHAGTLEDPIPYANTMTVYNGKYYQEAGITYKCIRDSGQPLYATCASLVGNYFEVAGE